MTEEATRTLVRRAAVACAALATAIACACAASPAAASAAVAPVFGSPQLIDSATPYTSAWNPVQLSCGSPNQCVALGPVGSSDIQVSTTTNAGGPGAPTWSMPADAGLAGFTPIQMTCPTATLCVAVGNNAQTSTSEAVSSSDGGETWSAPDALETSSSTDEIAALGCTTAGRCVTVDQQGNAFYRDPSSVNSWNGPQSLTSLSPTPAFGVASASCFGTETCVLTAVAHTGVNFEPVLLATTDVGDSDPVWSESATTDSGATPEGVSCATGGTCMAVDNQGNVLISTDPGASTPWTVYPLVDDNPFRAASCPSDDECVLTDLNGGSVIASDVSSSSPEFTAVPVGDSSGAVSPLSCPSTTWCVGAQAGTVWYGQVNPSTPSQTAWSSAQVYGTNELLSLACSPTGGVCAAADSKGRVVVSGDGGTSWSAPATLTGATTSAGGLSCTADGMCVLLSSREAYVATGVGAGGGSPSWSSGTTLGETRNSINGLSCPSQQLCVAVDTAGNAVVSTDPASASSSWTILRTGAGVALKSISCPSATLCVAGDINGNVWYTTTPGSGRWTGPDSVDSGDSITSLWCQASGPCVAGDARGQVLDSPDVTEGQSSWSDPVSSGASAPITSLACTPADGGACTATTGNDGGSAVSGPSVVGSGNWSVIAGAPTNLTRVACTSELDCVWTDATGDAIPSTFASGTVALSTSALSFPETTVGASSPAQVVSVTDSGSGPLNVTGASLAGASPGSFSVQDDGCSNAMLSPGGTCTITVAFAPSSSGPLTASLQIASDDPSGTATVTLTGTGVTGTPAGSNPPTSGGGTSAPGGGTGAPGGGVPSPAPTVAKPAIGASLTGLSTRRPKLTITATAGKGAPALRQVTITLPAGLSFASRAATLRRMITVKAAGGTVKATIAHHGRTLTITVKNAARTLTITVRGPAISEAEGLRAKVRHHKLRRLELAVRATDKAGTTTRRTATAAV